MARLEPGNLPRRVVRTYRPRVFLGLMSALLVGLSCGFWFSYQYGFDQGFRLHRQVVPERDALIERAKADDHLIRSLQQRIDDLELGGEIEYQAAEEVRRNVRDLQDEISRLNEEIRFYKGIMTPDADDRGLRIHRLELRPGSEPGHIRYSLLLTQVVEKHGLIRGKVAMNLIGERAGGEVSLPFSDILAEGSQPLDFRFRYFQSIDGEVVVPAGMAPRQVAVVAESQGRGGVRRERSFPFAGAEN